MTPVLLGVVAALAWGVHDFLARFPSRAVGPIPTLFWVTAFGFILISAWLAASGVPVDIDWSKLWLPALSGIALALGALSLFAALALGPISLVAPIAGSYPALAMIFAVAEGARPSLPQWLAIVAVIGGVLIVSRSGRSYEQSGDIAPGKLSLILALSFLASLGFATALMSGQAATPIFGEVETVWIARSFGLVTVAGICLWKRTDCIPPRRWLPLLALMGALDVTALASVTAAGTLPDPAFATVVSSAFGAVTVVLARIFLREPISPIQLLGMVLIFAGVAGLASL
jgi:drug/metabolite transporter (DMT)-like permease